MSQKRPMTSFKLNIRQKMLKFKRATLENITNRETFRYFSELKIFRRYL